MTAHPHKARIIAVAVAVFFVVVFVVVGLLLRSSSTGVTFYVSDQIAMIGIGLILALAALWFARPRVRADHDGVEVRNMLGTHRYRWAEVTSVSFPDGSPWARLELPADEYIPILAVQAIDGEHAVTAMRELRRLRREADAETETDAESR
ncbi:PH domain-containing protein [Actinophytocola oryzae]|uniref:PH (Pleckstrin Homology) domain-containing protein n=1 Tax=Actinophytocola oryzae TaxID=502181 RepID=A0A4R7VIQ2_9PSEU|nr:PH domain-containing protein [Actinophytocola oryzae]TDV49009.1 PH (Pleckstrin Homology) domain-containing protein [Actinophytocola oryzae]